MPNLIGPETLDTTSTNGPCTYPAKVLGAGGIYVSPSVYVNKQPLRFSHAGMVPDPVEGIPNNPAVPCVLPTVPRVAVGTVNTSVYINKFLPLVQGDKLQSLGTDRPLTGPFQYPNIILASKGK